MLAVTNAPGVLREYCNYINITWNAFDVRLHFGETDVIQAPDGKVHVETKAVITVAWNEAKQISELLTQLIHRFEQANGPITRIGDVKIPTLT